MITKLLALGLGGLLGLSLFDAQTDCRLSTQVHSVTFAVSCNYEIICPAIGDDPPYPCNLIEWSNGANTLQVMYCGCTLVADSHPDDWPGTSLVCHIYKERWWNPATKTWVTKAYCVNDPCGDGAGGKRCSEAGSGLWKHCQCPP
jgi:hypothetical protein